MTPLEKDYAVLVQICNDDKSGALKEYFGDGDDPREWGGEDGRGKDTAFVVQDCEEGQQRVAILRLYAGSKLKALPDAIGKLGALKELDLACSSLVELPDAIGELKALTMLNLSACDSLERLPDAIDGRYGARQARTVKLPKHLKWTGPEGEMRVEKRAEKGAAVKRDSKIPAKYKQFSVS